MMKKLLFLIAISLILLSAFVTFIYAYVSFKPDNIILMYHSIQPTPLNQYEDMYVSPDDLETQFKIINDLNISTRFVNEVNSSGIYITFDDGYEDNYTYAFPLIKEYKVKVTIFVITDLIGEESYLNEEQIKEMSDSGFVSFQSHTVSHQDLTTLDNEQLIYELKSSKEKLESITGQIVDAISYPFGAYDNNVIDAVSQYYNVAVTTKGPNLFHTGKDKLTLPRYGIPNVYDISSYSNLIQY